MLMSDPADTSGQGAQLPPSSNSTPTQKVTTSSSSSSSTARRSALREEADTDVEEMRNNRKSAAGSTFAAGYDDPYQAGGGEEEKKPMTLKERVGKYGLGVGLILLVAVIWVGASIWIQYIFGSLHYDKPFFLTYFNTACFSGWNMGYLISNTWKKIPWKNKLDDVDLDLAKDIAQRNGSPGNCDDSDADAAAARKNFLKGKEGSGSNTVTPAVDYNGGTAVSVNDGSSDANATTPYSLYRIFHCALLFCPMWFLANCLFNYSLSRTSVASNTVLSTTSSVWTLLLSRWLLHDGINGLKIIAIFLSIGGTTLVAFSDDNSSDNGSDGMSGDVLALISAFFYGAYTTVLRWCLPEDEKYSMGMAFGAVGVINTLLMWPGFILLHFSNIEPFELPTWGILWPLLINTIIGTNLSDVLWAKSVILTSPLVATLGLSLTTPIAMIADAVIQGQTYTGVYILGAGIVTCGFVVANLPGDRIALYLLGGAEDEEKKQQQEGTDTSSSATSSGGGAKKTSKCLPSPLLEAILGVDLVPEHQYDQYQPQGATAEPVAPKRAGGYVVTLRKVK